MVIPVVLKSMCLVFLLEQLLKVRGERARWFGPGESGQILDEDVEALILEKVLRRPDRYALEFLSVHCGNVELTPSAVVQLAVEGNKVRQYASGSGPVDAVFNAVCQAVCRKPHLEEFSINAISGGTDAQGEVTVRVREGDASTVGRGVHDDVIMASTLAFVNALNRLANKEDDRTCPRP